MSENITVAVRVRPFLPDESPSSSCVSVRNNQVELGNCRCFAFDYIFDQQADADCVFSCLGHPVADAVMGGFNASTIAYGQTGSGKTFTMTALAADVIREIFYRLPKTTHHVGGADGFTMQLSVLEVYNESLGDLLKPLNAMDGGGGASSSPTRTNNSNRSFSQSSNSPPKEGSAAPQLREDPKGGIYVSGLTVVDIRIEEELLRHIDRATANRKTASTMMNATSSRSHCIFTLTLQHRGGTSRCCFVDLAGSERLKKSLGLSLGGPSYTGRDAGEPTGSLETIVGSHATALDRIKEGISINGGLLALGNVIAALSERKPHVPYRSSKLTRVLQPMLGGNSKTTIVACISPLAMSFEETLNTLKYADRAKSIKTSPHFVVSTFDSAEESQRTIMALRRELESTQKLLAVTLADRGSGPAATSSTSGPPGDVHRRGDHSTHGKNVTGGTAATSAAHSERCRKTTNGVRRMSAPEFGSSSPLPPPVPATHVLMAKQVRDLQQQLADEQSNTKRLEDDLFKAEYLTMIEVENRKALEERIAELTSALLDPKPSSDTMSSVRTASASSSGLALQAGDERVGLRGRRVKAKGEPRRRLCAALTLEGGVDAAVSEPTDGTHPTVPQIEALAAQNATAARQLAQYQRELASLTRAKAQLEEELRQAEERIEAVSMAREKKEKRKAKLHATFVERLRRAEAEIVEYQRRVKRAEQEINMRSLNMERMSHLQKQVRSLREETSRQRAGEAQRMQQSVAHQQEVDRLVRQLQDSEDQVKKLKRSLAIKTQKVARVKAATSFELPSATPKCVPQTEEKTQSQSTTPTKVVRICLPGSPTAGASSSSSADPKSPQSAPTQHLINNKVVTLGRLEKELGDLQAYRQVLAMAQLQDAPKYRKAIKGYRRRLSVIERGLSEESKAPNSAVRDQLLTEKDSIEKQIKQLDSFEEMFGQASLQLEEFDHRIDSLNETRKYHLRQVRQLQHMAESNSHDTSDLGNATAHSPSNPPASVLGIQTSPARHVTASGSLDAGQSAYIAQLEDMVAFLQAETNSLKGRLTHK